MHQRSALLVCFATGLAVMNGEIAAGRLLAPYYGTSTTTWALLIGTVLLSLAVGNLLGGRLSKVSIPERQLVCLMAGSAGLLALLPRVAPWLMTGSMVRFQRGELFPLAAAAGSVALLLAIPIVLLGAVSPLVLHATARRQLPEKLGRVAGRLQAAGTLGSLVGTLGAGLVFVPWLGTTRTHDLGAIVLFGTAAAIALRLPKRALAIGATSSALVLALVGSLPPMPSPRAGRLVWTGESRYNHITVTDEGDQRQLRMNDGFAVQSFTYHDGRLPVRDVWAYYALAPIWGQNARPRRVLLLGLGGGTAAQIYRHLYPDAEVTGVELDSEMVRAGQRYLGVDLQGVRIVIEDARTFVTTEVTKAPYDVILLDAFQFPYVPFQLTTQEFFRQVADCVAPGGLLMVNAGRYGEHRDVVRALARTLSTAFAHVQEADAANASNTLLVATQHDPATAVGTRGLLLAPESVRELERLAVKNRPMQPARFTPTTPVMTDDHAPVEWLTDRIVWKLL